MPGLRPGIQKEETMLTSGQKEIREAFVAALRSGRYKKARYALRTADRYCATGVLCDVFDRSLWDVHITLSAQHRRVPRASFYAPCFVIEAAGLTPSQLSLIMNANDGGDKTFAEIADMVEAF